MVNILDGPYYITVRALNKVQLGGPMAVTVCHTQQYIIDTTPPIVYGVTDVTYNGNDPRIVAHYNIT